MVIVIDPGHGGVACGAYVNDVKESSLNLDIGTRLAALLAVKHTVLMTRSTDVPVSLVERQSFISKSGAGCAVSIHHNAGAVTASGFEVFHADGSAAGLSLAQSVVAAVIADSLGRKIRGIKAEGLSQHRRLAVLHGGPPSILIECGFMTNDEEMAWLAVMDNRQAMARAIASGVSSWAARQ